MIVIVCVDNQNGVMFNHRRQSQDKELTAEILKMVKDKPLYVSRYSKSLFPEDANIIVTEDFNELTEENFAFIEDKILDISQNNIDRLILCRWNRDYPSDIKLPFDTESYFLQSRKDITGNSHDKIRIEIYEIS